MSKKQELEISISDTGEVTVNVLGAKGKKCMDMTKELEDSLGVITSFEKKPEFYEQEETGTDTVVQTEDGINV
jgi:hypothetical protein